MLKRLKTKTAQASFGEYSLIFAIVLAMMVAMGVYFRRAFQGRMFDARNHIVNSVRDIAGSNYVNGLVLAYEPYYTNTSSTLRISQTLREEDSSVATTGFTYKKDINDSVSVRSVSVTKPPKDAK
jgi:hypothetical protein